tara:strand:- start:32420 stop:33025 length:606 start_codon:yes stop_codon:yes gene_type:complete
MGIDYKKKYLKYKLKYLNAKKLLSGGSSGDSDQDVKENIVEDDIIEKNDIIEKKFEEKFEEIKRTAREEYKKEDYAGDDNQLLTEVEEEMKVELVGAVVNLENTSWEQLDSAIKEVKVAEQIYKKEKREAEDIYDNADNMVHHFVKLTDDQRHRLHLHREAMLKRKKKAAYSLIITQEILKILRRARMTTFWPKPRPSPKF